MSPHGHHHSCWPSCQTTNTMLSHRTKHTLWFSRTRLVHRFTSKATLSHRTKRTLWFSHTRLVHRFTCFTQHARGQLPCINKTNTLSSRAGGSVHNLFLHTSKTRLGHTSHTHITQYARGWLLCIKQTNTLSSRAGGSVHNLFLRTSKTRPVSYTHLTLPTTSRV